MPLKRVTNTKTTPHAGMCDSALYEFAPGETKVLEASVANHLVMQSTEGSHRVLRAEDAPDLAAPPPGEVATARLDEPEDAKKPTVTCPYPGCGRELVENSIGYRKHTEAHVRSERRQPVVVEPKAKDEDQAV